MAPEETLDDLRGYDLRLYQPRHGYRFSLDPLLLADFAGGRDGDRVADLGTGCGVVALVLARRLAGSTLTGVEFDPVMAGLARRNAELNGLADRVAVIEADILALPGLLPAAGFDLVVSNPPFRVPGTGRVSPRAGRDRARHESTAGLADFLAAAKRLATTGGRICLVYHPERLAELVTAAAGLKLTLKRLRTVHGTAGADGRMVLVELVKGRKGALRVLPPLLVYGADGGYSDEVARIMGGDIC